MKELLNIRTKLNRIVKSMDKHHTDPRYKLTPYTVLTQRDALVCIKIINKLINIEKQNMFINFKEGDWPALDTMLEKDMKELKGY